MCYVLRILVLERLKKKNPKFEANLYITRPCLKKGGGEMYVNIISILYRK